MWNTLKRHQLRDSVSIFALEVKICKPSRKKLPSHVVNVEQCSLHIILIRLVTENITRGFRGVQYIIKDYDKTGANGPYGC